jgi:hypothetical protein
MADFTHNKLNDIALKWLKRSFQNGGVGCHISLPEVGSIDRYGGERVDAFGYRWGFDGGSTVVEVKVSRSDYLADAKKPHRINPSHGIGEFRYYMCPEGLISLDELPANWGLLWVGPRNKVTVMTGHQQGLHRIYGHEQYEQHVKQWKHKFNNKVERDLMAHLIAKIGNPNELLNERRLLNSKVSDMQNRLNKLIG